MAAPKGNKFYLLADWGKPVRYTPTELAAKFEEYVTWANSKPWLKEDFIKSGMTAGQKVQLRTERPLSIRAFCVYANMAHSTFYEYKTGKNNAKEHQAYSTIITRIEEVCYVQKVEGATVGAFNASIIARELGIREQTDVKVEGNIQWNETKSYESEKPKDKKIK